jgi:uncharacterized iron-regulated membrane protein
MTKAALLRIHRYAGLLAALFLFVQALTGCLLVYRDDAARLIDPAGMQRKTTGGMAPLASVLAAARAVESGAAIERLYYPASKQGTFLVQMHDEAGKLRFASVDPGNATVLRHGGLWTFPVEAALKVHYTWLAGKAGTAVVVLSGFCLLTLGISGISFWWPRRRQFLKNLEIRTHLSARLVLRQAHRTAGVLVSPILALMAVTGLMIAIPILLEAEAGAVGTTVIHPSTAKGVALAQAQFPGATIRDVRFPDATHIAVNFNAPERNSRAVHKASVDLISQQVVNTQAADQDGALWVIALPLHAGDAFGTVGHLLILLSGMTLAGLAVTGPLMWWQARRRPSAQKSVKLKVANKS